MSKKLIGMFASVALMGAGAAFAQSSNTDSQYNQDQQSQSSSAQTPSSDAQSGTGGSGTEAQSSDTKSTSSTTSTSPSSDIGTGGSGQTSTMGQEQTQQPQKDQGSMAQGGEQQGEQRLQGTVVKAQGSTLYVEHMGAIVALKTDKKTEFEGGTAKRAKDLKEGQQIQATFTVKNKVTNTAKSITVQESGTGGSGFEDLGSSKSGTLDNTGSSKDSSKDKEKDKGINDQGTGGSGLDDGVQGSTPDTMGTEPNSDLNNQTGAPVNPDQTSNSSSTTPDDKQ